MHVSTLCLHTIFICNCDVDFCVFYENSGVVGAYNHHKLKYFVRFYQIVVNNDNTSISGFVGQEKAVEF